MNKIIRSLFILSLSLFILSSCEKAEPGRPADGSGVVNPGGGGTQTGTSKVTFKLDGASKVGSNLDASYNKDSKVLTFSCDIKNGSKTEGLSLMISDFNGAKTYSAASDNVIAFYSTDISSDKTVDLFVAVSGNFVITSITDTTVAGTFQFEVINEKLAKKQITQGSFNIALSASDSTGPVIITPGSGDVDTEMTFKLDGVSKKADFTSSSENSSIKLLIVSCTIFGAKSESLSFDLGNFVNAPGTFTNVPAKYNSDIASLSQATVYHSTSGEVVVTNVDSKSISGTFKFEVKSDSNVIKKITEGKFTVDL